MGPLAERFAYDIFISHSSQDKSAARALAERLKTDGFRVWLDEWEIGPGDLIPLKIEQGLEQSRVLLLLMSESAFASEWVSLERSTAVFRDPANGIRRFIPIRLDDTPIREVLRAYAYVDFRTVSEEQYGALVKACQGPIPLSRRSERQAATSWMLLKLDSPISQLSMVRQGRWIAVCTPQLITILDLQSQTTVSKITAKAVTSMALTPDGSSLFLAQKTGEVTEWALPENRHIASIPVLGNTINALAVEPKSRTIFAVAGDDPQRLYRFMNDSWTEIAGDVSSIALPAEGHLIVASRNGVISRFTDSQELQLASDNLQEAAVTAMAVSSSRLLLGCSNGLLVVRDIHTLQVIARLEGHCAPITSVAITINGERGVSTSADGRHFSWDLSTGRPIQQFDVSAHSNVFNWTERKQIFPVEILPDGRGILFVPKFGELAIRLLMNAQSDSNTKRYTNAKVLLVGDTGVGKTGISLRLTRNSFEASVSTDAAWASHLKLPCEASSDDIEREIWLWDFAGQSDYRLIHQLFMDETALAVFVFNPQSDDPFEGLTRWDDDVKRAARREYSKLLVAGRCDRGGLTISRSKIDYFCSARGFAGYIETSALTGSGCDALRDAIVRYIPWDNIPWTSSPRIFKLLKEACIGLRSSGHVLLRMSELKQQIEMLLPTEPFSMADLYSVVGLLTGPGIVMRLEFGGFVLLVPERINSYAGALLRSVRGHLDEIGCIAEERVIAGDLDYQDMIRLPRAQEDIVLRAMHQTFIDRGLCFRENTETGPLLVFPSQFRRERPALYEHPAVFVTYNFDGSLEEIYATLIVRLHHTKAFERDQLWKFAADFKTQEGRRLGVKLTKLPSGAGELAVYFDPLIPDDTKVIFDRYVHEHLCSKVSAVTRFRHFVCPHCATPVENQPVVRKRIERGEEDILCQNCEQRVPLRDLLERKFASSMLARRALTLASSGSRGIGLDAEEIILSDHAYAIAIEASQKYERLTSPQFGIQARIEFMDHEGRPSGRCVQLQLRYEESYYFGGEIFNIKNEKYCEYWQNQRDPVMLVVRKPYTVSWMNVTSLLQSRQSEGIKYINKFDFKGEPMTALNLLRMRDRCLGYSGQSESDSRAAKTSNVDSRARARPGSFWSC